MPTGYISQPSVGVDAPFDLLVIMPYWEGDKGRVISLVELICGLQSHGYHSRFHFLMAPRFDTSFDEASISRLSTHFPVHRFHCTGSGKGHPAGSNGQFVSSMMHVASRYSRWCRVVLWLEPDMIPCRREWLDTLVHIWDARRPGVQAMGHIFSINGDHVYNHLNGGALYSPKIVQVIPRLMTFNYNVAWDWFLRKEFLNVAQDITEIRYQHQGRAITEFPSPVPCILHNVKDESLVRLVASKYGIVLESPICSV